MSFIQRCMPRTLLVRTFMLIALLMLLSLLAWFSLYTRLEKEPRAKQRAQTLVSIANLTRTALETAHPNARRYLLQELSDREGIHIYPTEDDDQINEDLPPFMERTAILVRAELGQKTRFATELNGERAMFVTFSIGDDEYWVALPRERIERNLPQQWLSWSLAATLLAMFGAWLVIFRITRPLKALTQAAKAVGRGEPAAALDESGPTELATVASAFNQMNTDLNRMNQDRALVLAGISHDVRTPLTRLRMSVEMSGADDASRQEMITDIEEIDQTLGQFLDFARGDEGETFVHSDVSALMQTLVEHYARRGLNLQTEIAPGVALDIRPKALRRAVANLIDNSRKYGSEPITLRLEAITDKSMAITISDCGPGIPEADMERVKQPFTRLNEARSNTAGSGLGLAIVERIARAHGGTLALTQCAGGGLAARITLAVQHSA